MLRVLDVGFLVVALSIVGLAAAAAVFVRQAVSRIEIDPKALGDTMRDAMIVTLREGTPEQKLGTIASLGSIGVADAAPFVSPLTDATKDENPEVRQAAIAALKRISPDANVVAPEPPGPK